jgi:hypothetical protein
MKKDHSWIKKVEGRVLAIAKGNPGAVNAIVGTLMEVGEGENADAFVLALEELALVGPAVWVAYKDHCKHDRQSFYAAVVARDPAMMETVKREGC